MRLSRNGATLVATAQRFPSAYTFGEPSPGAIVVLGDSTALGVGADRYEETLAYRVASEVASRRAVRRVVNLGVSGARTRDVVRDQLPRLPDGPIDFALVSVTANDATHGTSPSDLRDDLVAIFKALEARGVKRAVVTNTPNFRGTPALPWPVDVVFAGRARDLASTVAWVAARFPFVRVADLNGRGTLKPDEYASDGFHPNAEGYRRWTRLVVGVIH